MVESAFFEVHWRGALISAAGSREDVVVFAVSDFFFVFVGVAGEDSVVAVGEGLFEPRPVGDVLFAPEGLVHEDESPADVLIPGQESFEVFELLAAEAGEVAILGAEDAEENVFVYEVVVSAPAVFCPKIMHRGVGEVVVTGDEEEGHVELVEEAIEFVILGAHFVGVLGVAFDEVADADDEFGAHPVDLDDGFGEDGFE